MAFGQNFLSSFSAQENLRDYTHASNIFRSNSYENAPRFKFAFHVYFTLNTTQIPALRQIYGSGDQSTIGLLVKSIELPKYKVDVDVMNQYNRKRIVQKKIEYEPVNISFHDDGGDLIRGLWFNYFSYYFKDPNQPYNGAPSTNGTNGRSAVVSNGYDYNSRDTYTNVRQINDWGYIGEAFNDATTSTGGKPAFFKDISIYGFNQHKFVEYVLINPTISSWNHDTYTYERSDVMENTVSILYETVKYYEGDIGGVRPDTNVQGFADPASYDVVTSPLKRPNMTRSVVGQGSLLDTGIGQFGDLSTGGLMSMNGATQAAATQFQTYNRPPSPLAGGSLFSQASNANQCVLSHARPGQPPTNTLAAPGGFNSSLSPTFSTFGYQSLLQNPSFPIPSPRCTSNSINNFPTQRGRSNNFGTPGG